jgi:manganese oxidase
MTEYLITQLERRRLASLVRPSAAIALALALAFVGGLWLTTLRALDGAAGGAGFAAAWLRDSTLALPVMLAAVWLAMIATRRLARRHRLGPRGAGVLLGVLAAGAGSVAAGLLSPLQGALSGAGHGAHDIPVIVHVGRDAFAAFPVFLVVSLVVCAALASRTPWEMPDARAWRAVPRGRRLALGAVAATLLLAPLGLATNLGVNRAVASSGPGTPCPAGAPVKSFDVNAINLDITLNRFLDHDPLGQMYVLKDAEAAVRAEEASRHVTTGLRDDPIQPLVIRANMGDCVEINFLNKTASAVGVHIDGLAFDTGSSGDQIGANASSQVSNGGSILYRYYVPKDPETEGTHYIRPGPGNRDAVSHGLFGALVVEPQGSRYLHNDRPGVEVKSGWEAIIVPGAGKAFREDVLIHHEIGNEKYKIHQIQPDGTDIEINMKDPHTTAYRPGSRALNYRSEPFMNRLDVADTMKAYSYNSYTFADPATPTPRGYLSDPTKLRIMHAGSEMFHVFHLHGGGDRWPQNPHADPTWNYGNTGLRKTPITNNSQRLDSQSIGPGESYTLEIEGGAGGSQQVAGDFLFHCHIAEHYVAGMWAFWRVFDTKQPDLAAIPGRTAPPDPVSSADLVGKTIDGQAITADNLKTWVEMQLPPRGVRKANPIAGQPEAAGPDFDGSVVDWIWSGDRALGEPEDTHGPGVEKFANLSGPADGSFYALPDHPGLRPGDKVDGSTGRPEILFNPQNGRPAFPFLRPHIGDRAPFSGQGHTGAPQAGEWANKPLPASGVNPWDGRKDGMCPATAPERDFNVVSIQKPIQVTQAGAVDPNGKIWVLAKNKDKVRSGVMPSEPLAIRGNIGDCIQVTVTSEQTPSGGGDQPFPMTNLHIHHVQFDPSASDGATAGFAYGQGVRPYRMDDPTLSAAAAAGATSITVSNATKFHLNTWIGIGLGTEGIEVRQITDISGNTLTLGQPLAKAHAAGQWAGYEFVRETWYPDVVLDNIFWHDHVDGIHNWGHGLVGQLIIEPKGSTYHDPVTGEQVDSGDLVDIHTNESVAPGIPGSFRELAIWTIDENPAALPGAVAAAGVESTINLRAAPWADRLAANPDPSKIFDSSVHGDPNTPLPRMYPGDPFVVRAINVSPNMDTVHFDGNRWSLEPRLKDANGDLAASPITTMHYGVSERYSAFFASAGGPNRQPGDYLYNNGVGRRFRDGAWGIIRVLPSEAGDLKPLPGVGVQAPGSADPCPAGAPVHSFDVSAVDIAGGLTGRQAAFVPTADAAAVSSGAVKPDPLALHVAAGECVVVHLTNQRATARASFHADELLRSAGDSGITIGNSPDQTVGPGESRDYRLFADTRKLGAAQVSDFGGEDSGTAGLYGAVVVAPAGATFTDPATGAARDIGTQVDVHVPGQAGYRDFTLAFSEDDPFIGANTTPYNEEVVGPALLNYRTAPRLNDTGSAFAGNPGTVVLKAYAGDPVKVHALGAPGDEQHHVLSLGGQTWRYDDEIAKSIEIESLAFGPMENVDADVIGGAGGRNRTVGDFFVGDMRRPFTRAGMWGVMRVMSDASCPIKPLDGLTCTGQQPVPDFVPGTLPPEPVPVVVPPVVTPPAGNQGPGPNSGPSASSGSGSGSGSVSASGGPGSGGSKQSTGKQLRDLRLPKSISLSKLVSKGMAIKLTAPKGSKVVRLRLFQTVKGKRVPAGIWVLRTGARLELTRLAKGTVVKVSSSGKVSILWRPARASVRSLKAGTWTLEVTTGTSTTTFLRETISGKVRLTGKLPAVRHRKV